MPIKTEKLHKAVCDECHEELECLGITLLYSTKEELVKEATSMGWHTKNEQCLCPDCKKDSFLLRLAKRYTRLLKLL